jgi:hypothetical protein
MRTLENQPPIASPTPAGQNPPAGSAPKEVK